MKRSAQVRLVLLGGIASGALSGGTPLAAAGSGAPSVRGDAVYGNDHLFPSIGHYHAPYRGWYALPYNHYDPQRRLYFHGGNWTPTPHESIINLSEPRPEALQAALTAWQQQQRHIRRSGFGTTSRSHFTSS